MFDMEEKQLNKINQEIKDIPKPENINEYIRKGIALGVKKKKKNRIRIFSNIAAVLFIAIFVTSVRTLPVFAALVSKVPGLEYVVDLINFDKGLKSAVENNFIDHLNLSETHEDLTFSITDVIIDSSKAIIFYSMESKGNHHFVNIASVNILDDKGEGLKAGVGWGSSPNDNLSEKKKLTGRVDVNFTEETELPDKIYAEFTLRESDNSDPRTDNTKNSLKSIWKFEIPVAKEKIKNMQKTYAINQSVLIEGQKILFKQATITPTRISVDIEYDKNNTKKIFRYDDLKLVNEKGEIWGTITNGVSGSYPGENLETVYFQSNYFTDPKELYIAGASIRAVDKDKCTVEIDMDNNRILKAPDERLSLISIDRYSSDTTTLSFRLKGEDPTDKNRQYFLFNNSFKDSTGNIFESNRSNSSSNTNGMQDLSIIINTPKSIKGSLYMTLQDYPIRIKGDFKVKIK